MCISHATSKAQTTASLGETSLKVFIHMRDNRLSQEGNSRERRGTTRTPNVTALGGSRSEQSQQRVHRHPKAEVHQERAAAGLLSQTRAHTKKERKQTTQGRDGRTVRRHHTGTRAPTRLLISFRRCACVSASARQSRAQCRARECCKILSAPVPCPERKKKTDKPKRGPRDGGGGQRVHTCTSRILEGRSGGQVGLSCS